MLMAQIKIWYHPDEGESRLIYTQVLPLDQGDILVPFFTPVPFVEQGADYLTGLRISPTVRDLSHLFLVEKGAE